MTPRCWGPPISNGSSRRQSRSLRWSPARPAPRLYSQRSVWESRELWARSQDSRHIPLAPRLTSRVILDKPKPPGRRTPLWAPFQSCSEGQINQLCTLHTLSDHCGMSSKCSLFYLFFWTLSRGRTFSVNSHYRSPLRHLENPRHREVE